MRFRLDARDNRLEPNRAVSADGAIVQQHRAENDRQHNWQDPNEAKRSGRAMGIIQASHDRQNERDREVSGAAHNR